MAALGNEYTLCPLKHHPLEPLVVITIYSQLSTLLPRGGKTAGELQSEACAWRIWQATEQLAARDAALPVPAHPGQTWKLGKFPGQAHRVISYKHMLGEKGQEYAFLACLRVVENYQCNNITYIEAIYWGYIEDKNTYCHPLRLQYLQGQFPTMWGDFTGWVRVFQVRTSGALGHSRWRKNLDIDSEAQGSMTWSVWLGLRLLIN